MGKLSKEEREQLAALQAKAEAPDDDEDQDQDDGADDDGVIVLRGARADSFLAGLFPAKKKAAKKAAPGAAGDDEDQDDGADDDSGEGEPDGDPKPTKATPRYFRR